MYIIHYVHCTCVILTVLTLTLTGVPGVPLGSCLRGIGGVEVPRGLPSVCALVLCSGTGGGSVSYLIRQWELVPVLVLVVIKFTSMAIRVHINIYSVS